MKKMREMKLSPTSQSKIAMAVVVAGVLTFGAPGTAFAIPLVQGQGANISIDDGLAPNLKLDGMVTFTTVSQNLLVFNFMLKNNSTNTAVIKENRMVSFGFNVQPDANVTITGASNTLSPDWSNSVNNVNISNGFRVDVCTWDGSNCTGGANEGLYPGDTLNIGVSVMGTFTPPLEFEQFVARFQSTGTNQNGSISLQATLTPAPEPATLGVLSVGLIGLGFAARRRRKAA